MSHSSAAARLACLRELHLDQGLEDELVARLRDVGGRIARDFDTAACLISVIEADRQRFVMAYGAEAQDVPLEQSFCVRTLTGEGVAIMRDVAGHPDFANHPMVAEAPFIRFHASVALRSAQGLPYGALCVFDPAPKPGWTARETERLALYGSLISDLFARRTDTIDLANARTLLASGPTGTLIWRAETALPLVYASENLATIFRCDVEAHLRGGAGLDSLIHPADRAAFRAAMAGHVEAGHARSDLSYRLILPDGTAQWVRQTCQMPQLRHMSERLIFAYLTDETPQREQEAANALSRERLAVAAEAARAGIFDLDLATLEPVVDEGVTRMLGHGPGRVEGGVEGPLALFHPDDRARVEGLLRNLTLSRDMAQIECRIRHRDGHYVWVRSSGKVAEYDAAGRPKRMVGSLIDVTEAKRDAARGAKQRQLLEVLNRAQASFMFSHDLKQACDGLFEPLLKVTGSPFGFIGVMRRTGEGRPYLLVPTLSELNWTPEALGLYRDHLTEEGLEFHHLQNLLGHAVIRNEVVMANDLPVHPSAGGLPPGHPPITRFLGLPLRYGASVVGMIGLANAEEGYDQELVDLLEPLVTTLGALIHARDVEMERQRIERELAVQATTDALTGLPNRRQFEEAAREEIARGVRAGLPMVMAIMDLDLFKSINDNHGHAAGDAVLQAFGAHLRDTVRARDLLCRFGGEEFAVLMPGTRAAQAHQALERLRSTVAAHPTLYNGASIPLTLSIGLAEGSGAEASLDRLLRAADAALYAAKMEGRNRICHAEGTRAARPAAR